MTGRLKDKATYFHSTMTSDYREDQCKLFLDSAIWGLFCTDAFGMGMDIPDVDIVIQWKATCDMCMLWQRFGRVARGWGCTGVAILLVEKKNTDDVMTAFYPYSSFLAPSP
ncbi:P-loop containing nucleoside triphosphate hydrolase protein [Coprinopsis sp. MPI-PUGE-AT-0042]|nr:P-loop containing nucleoside triphosphate hydrolase protein [Coprinopsis sp. MPI-PUGE-AT-0042]